MLFQPLASCGVEAGRKHFLVSTSGHWYLWRCRIRSQRVPLEALVALLSSAPLEATLALPSSVPLEALAAATE